MDDSLQKICPYAKYFESNPLTGIQWVNNELNLKKLGNMNQDDRLNSSIVNFGVRKSNDGCFYIDFNY
jgi:hypothetical protein